MPLKPKSISSSLATQKRVRKSRKNTKAPCEVCSSRKLSKKSGLYRLKKGDTHLRQYLPATPELTSQATIKQSQHVSLTGLKPNRVVFYFATTSNMHTTMGAKITEFVKAYDTLQNSGVGKTDNSGKMDMNIACPQIYLAEDGQIYSRHFHIIYWDARIKKWDDKIYTHQIFCSVDKQFVKSIMRSHPGVVIIDALSPEYFNKKHIKGAINIPAKGHQWTLTEIMAKLPAGSNATTPMILYCWSPECNAAEKLWGQLNKLGFYNTFHYEGGISQWDGDVE